jgi:RNA polymerase sigma-70 factor (ECF subfamily)
MLRALSVVGDSEGPPSPAVVDPLEAVTAAAARGDARAIHTLIVAVSPAILRAVLGVLGANHPEVEDVVQESALGLVSALGRFRRECKVQHFAARIAVRTALKARRRLGSRGDAYAEPVRSCDLPFNDVSPGKVAHDARRREILRSLFGELPEAQSEALVMHFALELTVEEIADATDAPVNTVRSRLRLARVSLRARIEADPALRDALEVLP